MPSAVVDPGGHWGSVSTLRDVVLQAVACPVPWNPGFVDSSIRSHLVNSGVELRSPPDPNDSFLRTIWEIVQGCRLRINQTQYDSILTYDGYSKTERARVFELVISVALIALCPLTAQHIRILSESRLKDQGCGFKIKPWFASTLLPFVSVLVSYWLFFFFIIPEASLSITFSSACFIGWLVHISAWYEVLPELISLFLLPAVSFCFPLNLVWVVVGQVLLIAITKLMHLMPIVIHRSMQMIVTCIAILGVDFLTFPREYAKSVNSGVTLMDLGVGGIIFTSGLVSRQAKGGVDNRTWWSRLRTAVTRSGPLGVAGLLRFLIMGIIGKHAPISEYGEHWNFYLTLMVVFIFGELVCSLIPNPYSAGIFGFAILLSGPSLMHVAALELIITMFNLENWMFEGSRRNVFSANREGILGCIGFSCLFLISVAIGHFYHSRASRHVCTLDGRYRVGHYGRTTSSCCATELSHVSNGHNSTGRTARAVILPILLMALCSLATGYILQDVLGIFSQRRFVNMPWVAFVTGIELLALLFATLCDVVAARPFAQWALLGVNSNQLVIFLVSNVAVGLINIAISTLLQPAVVVFLVILIYVTALCLMGYYFGVHHMHIKLCIK